MSRSSERRRIERLRQRTRAANICSYTILALALAVLVFAPLAGSAVQPWAQGVIEITVVFMIMVWTLRILVQGEGIAVFPSMGGPLAFFAIFVFVRSLVSVVEPAARPEAMMIMAAVLMFFVILNNLDFGHSTTILLWTLTGLGTLLALYAIWHLVSGGRPIPGVVTDIGDSGRLALIVLDPGHIAPYLVMVFPMAAANILFSRRGYGERMALVISCFVMAIGLVLTFSRGGWLALLAMLVILGVYLSKKDGPRRQWAVIGTVVTCVVLAAVLGWLHLVGARELTAGGEVLTSRWPLWQSTWVIGLHKMWQGSGPGMFKWLYPSHRSIQGQPAHAHNEYLEMFANYGIAGCIALLWASISYLRTTYKMLRLHQSRYSADLRSNRYAFAVGGFTLFIGMLVYMAFDSSLHVPGLLFMLITLLAATLVSGVRQRDEHKDDRPGRIHSMILSSATKPMMAVALGVVIIVFGLRLAKSYPAQLLLRTANRDLSRLDWSAAESSFLRAWDSDNTNPDVAMALGDLYSARAAWNSRQRTPLCREAIQWYERAINLNMFATDALVKTAKMQDALGQREKADDLFQKALLADPDNATYHALLGLHNLRWKDPDAAIVSFRHAQELGALDSLAEIELKKLEKAEKGGS